jgi:hypothetical protein
MCSSSKYVCWECKQRVRVFRNSEPLFTVPFKAKKDLNQGKAAARARGRKGGRKQSITEKKIATAQKLADTSTDSIADICIMTSWSSNELTTTVKRYGNHSND